MILTNIQSAYGVINNTSNVIYTLWGVNSAGTQSSLATWTHNGNTKFKSHGVSVNYASYGNKYLYITAGTGIGTGQGFSATLIFTNNDCIAM